MRMYQLQSTLKNTMHFYLHVAKFNGEKGILS